MTKAIWWQLAIRCSAEEVDELENSLWHCQPLAITQQDAQDQPIFEPLPGETPHWPHNWLTALFDDSADRQQIDQQLAKRLTPSKIADYEQYRWAKLEDQQWITAWQQGLGPMDFGHNFWICPSHCQPTAPQAINLFLDPGLAFGTGTHESTAMCLTWLAKQGWQGETLLDYGCGSGVLAIAALLLGAGHAWGVDIDDQALLASETNAQRNQVSHRLTVQNTQEPVPDNMDVVVANILARPLMALAPVLCQALKPNGWLVLAGITKNQVSWLQDAYQPWLTLEIADQRDDWILLAGQCTNSNP